MSDLRHYKKSLEISQQIFTNAFTSASPKAPQPVHIQPPLYQHQLAALHAMREKELAFQRGYQIPNSEEVFFSKVAILGEGIGMGKTLSVLGHISQMATFPLTPAARHPLSNLNPASTSACFSIIPQATTENLYDSLIVVPHTIYRQWQDAVTEQTSLKALFLRSQKDLDKDSLLTSLHTSHCTLISNTLLPVFLGSLRAREVKSPMWRRVFYDEADTIKLTGSQASNTMPEAYMNWLISSSIHNLLFTNEYYHSYILRQLPESLLHSFHPELQEEIQAYTDQHPNVTFFRMQSYGFFKSYLDSKHPLRGHLVLKSTKAFLQESVQLPPLQTTIYRCQSPPVPTATFPPDVDAMLMSGDIQSALQALGVASYTPMTIAEAVTLYQSREKQRLERLYEFKQSEGFPSDSAKELALQSLQERIDSLTKQIDETHQRIHQATKESCSICYEDSKDPVLVPCCSKQFCAKCVLSWMSRTPSCPLCRSEILPTSLRAITPTPFAPKPQLPKKHELLKKIIEENPNGKFLIYSKYENPLDEIENSMEFPYPSATLRGNKNSIANFLADFEAGELKILLLDSKLIAAGMNLPVATHLILLHKLNKEEEKQILGRAYRVGRKTPLQFIKFLTQRE